jgi:hypothetical protein
MRLAAPDHVGAEHIGAETVVEAEDRQAELQAIDRAGRRDTSRTSGKSPDEIGRATDLFQLLAESLECGSPEIIGKIRRQRTAHRGCDRDENVVPASPAVALERVIERRRVAEIGDEIRQNGIRERFAVSDHAVEVEDQCSHDEPPAKVQGQALGEPKVLLPEVSRPASTNLFQIVSADPSTVIAWSACAEALHLAPYTGRDCLAEPVLPDAPQDTSRVDNDKIPDAPCAIFWGLCPYAIFCNHVLRLYVFPPDLDIVNQQMHHEVVSVTQTAAILQQKARIIAPKVGQVCGGPDEIEAKVLIELFGSIEISCGNVGLDLNGCHRSHGRDFLFKRTLGAATVLLSHIDKGQDARCSEVRGTAVIG